MALAVLPDSPALSRSKDGTLRLWDLASGDSRVLTGHTLLAVLPDGHALSASGDWSVIVWDLARSHPARRFCRGCGDHLCRRHDNPPPRRLGQRAVYLLRLRS